MGRGPGRRGYLLEHRLQSPTPGFEPQLGCAILGRLTSLCLIFFIWVLARISWINGWKRLQRAQQAVSATCMDYHRHHHHHPEWKACSPVKRSTWKCTCLYTAGCFSFWTNSHSNYILIHIHCITMQRMFLLGSVRDFKMCTSEAHICFLSGIHSSSGWTEEITNSLTCTV